MRFKVLFEKHFEEKGFFNSLWPTVVIPPVSAGFLFSLLSGWRMFSHIQSKDLG